MSSYLFFTRHSGAVPGVLPTLPEGCELTLWRPRLWAPVPAGIPGKVAAIVWGAFHALRVFRNRDYGVVLVRSAGRVIHRSYVFPGYFRFPFMDPEDLQIGSTWTAADWRRHGLASAALEFAVRSYERPGRTFWYLTDEANLASVRVVERCGFIPSARGRRTSTLGLRLLGAYVPD